MNLHIAGNTHIGMYILFNGQFFWEESKYIFKEGMRSSRSEDSSTHRHRHSIVCNVIELLGLALQAPNPYSCCHLAGFGPG